MQLQTIDFNNVVKDIETYKIVLVDCKCKLNKIYQATISVEYTLSGNRFGYP